jgi:hypothetical protein
MHLFNGLNFFYLIIKLIINLKLNHDTDRGVFFVEITSLKTKYIMVKINN